jgi:hypothetical protein
MRGSCRRADTVSPIVILPVLEILSLCNQSLRCNTVRRGWNEAEWQQKTKAILGNRNLLGIAWEFIPGTCLFPLYMRSTQCRYCRASGECSYAATSCR